MPELPDIDVYCDAIAARAVGSRLERARVLNPFVVRSVEPSLDAFTGCRLVGTRRIGKRVVLALDGAMYIVIHLMIAGRLRWLPMGKAPPAKGPLAWFAFESGTLALTEAGSKRRASIHLVRGDAALAALDPGGIEPLTATPLEFRTALRRDNRTLKRALTDPHVLSGIGNAYSDEILHRARLSPFALTGKLDDDGYLRLHAAVLDTLRCWRDRLARELGGGFPDKVTAFRDDFAVHGRYGKPCPDCGAPVQRIVHGAHETNYCARCQTGGRILADRALSRLLHESFPRELDA